MSDKVMQYVVSTDTGSSFIIAVVLDQARHITIGKAPPMPKNPAIVEFYKTTILLGIDQKMTVD